MKLEFKVERLSLIKRLKNMSITDIEDRMIEISGRKSRIKIDRWVTMPRNHRPEVIELVAEATGVPLGFFYYNQVYIKMADLRVTIFIPEIDYEDSFDFI